MTREESRQRRAIALETVKAGKTFEEAAEISGFGKDYVRQICAKEGIRKERAASYNAKGSKKRDICIALLKQGAPVETIMQETGYKSKSAIYAIARELGLDTTTDRHEAKTKRDEEVRRYIAEGHTTREAAERYSLHYMTVRNIARGIPRPTSANTSSGNQYTSGSFDREANAKKYFAKFEGFEYAGGFTHSEGRVDVRCLTCGYVFSRSMISIRHDENLICPACQERKRRDKEEEREQAKADRAIQSLNRKLKKTQDRQKWEASRKHPCPVCGRETLNRVYCSKACAGKAVNAAHEARRRMLIENQMVDKNITLKRLYKKDNGICHICGGMCDWDDREIRDGTVICGSYYPSIDHVIPLSRGGEHSWKNVKLAHRLCNTMKGAEL